ncbi:lipoate--protein ligase A [Paucilactobacillus oligofermentans DSM 15707 = LMG 22743]|uniref:Lipoate--protein ligase A n=1 Tax=Paucilactobacillus oligofermentans DSM 15707 = LMG 22743 TaxID=1423778 RepID=A0A0R1RXJ6_9LACO|nr:hypothetical protein [Paucilactobacillus oligofermentans]KRL58163.1 lipoate--protein ligase A [Paucilactobacillus oligofermentans DSM 15707 = LMG 22743]CUS26867.1 Lipoate-protein ligase [Paucilactobacillus oligofermentans DSM 15707 = LMG 22743]
MKLDNHFNSISILDQQLAPSNNLDAFAYTNTLLAKLSNTPFLHFWTLEDTLILGMTDQRLPHINDALTLLANNHLHYFVRNSGGLSVISDEGILNISLFIPISLPLTVDEAYAEMAQLIQTAFPELSIMTGEIVHSYCPGKFDLSVNGQKIGGISQRRNKNGTVIMLYLSINGNQTKRGQTVAEFYSAGLQDNDNNWNFPDVWPDSMINLDTLIPQLSVGETKQRILNVFASYQRSLYSEDIAFNTELTLQRESMRKRQTKLESRR